MPELDSRVVFFGTGIEPESRAEDDGDDPAYQHQVGMGTDHPGRWPDPQQVSLDQHPEAQTHSPNDKNEGCNEEPT